MAITLYLRADQPGEIERAAQILRTGGLVAFPTETVYGLGAHALLPSAVGRIFEAKGRPSWDPLIVHVAEADQIAQLTAVPESLAGRVQTLAQAFWPGPLTLLLPRLPVCPDAITAGRPLVGVRVPAHPVAQALLRAAGVPVAAPSANRFGHVSPTTAQHVLDDLDGRIDAVLDGGPTAVGVESTVVDPFRTPMIVYRAGAVTLQQFRNATGAEAAYFESGSNVGKQPREALPSPGVGLRHYAPEVQLRLTGPSLAELMQAVAEVSSGPGRICVLLPRDWSADLPPEVQGLAWGRWTEPATLAAELFGVLRSAEGSGAAVVLCPLPQPGGLRDAVRDRLLKAAMPRQS